MDFHKIVHRYRQFGGLRLMREYARLGVLWPITKAFFRCLIKRESFKRIYPEILKKIEPFLLKRYTDFLKSRKDYYSELTFEHKRSRVVWFCWLQGLENAPEIVKACYHSLQQHLTDRDIKVIDNNNWTDYIELPEYVVRKWEKGWIPAANFSDLLRLELLIRYGGTWIDSTVLCTGFDALETQESREYLEADLFLFQYTPPGTTKGISISNWFITACSNNDVLMVLRDMLVEYWKDYDCTIDYYIFHLFFYMLASEFPEKIGMMPYGNSMNSLVLEKHWAEAFSQKKWDRLTKKVCFHKLTYRVSDEMKKDEGNFYNRILLNDFRVLPRPAVQAEAHDAEESLAENAARHL